MLLGTTCFHPEYTHKPMTQEEAVPVTLARMEEKIDQCLEALKRGEVRMNNHSNRLQTLEIWKSRTVGYVRGAVAVIVAGGAAVGWIFGR